VSTTVGNWGSVLVYSEIIFLSGVILGIVSLIRVGPGAIYWGEPWCATLGAASCQFCCCELNPCSGSWIEMATASGPAAAFNGSLLLRLQWCRVWMTRACLPGSQLRGWNRWVLVPHVCIPGVLD